MKTNSTTQNKFTKKSNHKSSSLLKGLLLVFFFSFGTTASAQTFAPGITNPFGLTPVNTVNYPVLIDIDGDGDLDIVTSELFGQLVYFENIGTVSSPLFAAPLRPNWKTDTLLVNFTDIDNDGDYDMIGIDFNGNIYVYENVGSSTNPQFASGVINPYNINNSVLSQGLLELVDIDNDGDLDLFAGLTNGSIYFFENIGTSNSPDFGSTPVLNPFGLDSFPSNRIPTFIDIDDDGDYDLLVNTIFGELHYYENIGSASSPQFGPRQVNPFNLSIPNGLSKFAKGDIDDDGDTDLVLGAMNLSNQDSAQFIFFENQMVNVSIKRFFEKSVNVFPNPTTGMVHIETDAHVKAVRITNLDGKIIRETTQKDVSLGNLPSGVYFLTIVDENNAVRIERVIKQ
ncbi:MAG: T9SS type A sorting domain-containing protein [Cryomorphaceae bacterium]|nr:T9SS type A sorting domain-containing protein [Cryomorphaceae bacterium]